MMSAILIASERFAEHQTPPGHPESPERAAVMNDVAMAWRAEGHDVVQPRRVKGDELTLVHDPAYVDRIQSLAGMSTALDADTFTSPDTVSSAEYAAGAAVTAVEHVLGGEDRRAFALARPPGHHAERDRAMGFCLFNNVAVAAAVARRYGIQRVAIVDFDVHHGNGTQHIFSDDPDVLYLSTHQYPFYPGTGAAGDVGTGAGTGFTVNVPIELGATDDDYHVVCDRVVVPVLRQFAPQLVLISAGFDAHERDPLGSMRLTTEAFAAMTADVCRVAEDVAGGRVVAVLEGGYDLQALGACSLAVANVLAGERASWPVSSRPSSRGAVAVRQALAAHSGFWKLTG